MNTTFKPVITDDEFFACLHALPNFPFGYASAQVHLPILPKNTTHTVTLQELVNTPLYVFILVFCDSPDPHVKHVHCWGKIGHKAWLCVPQSTPVSTYTHLPVASTPTTPEVPGSLNDEQFASLLREVNTDKITFNAGGEDKTFSTTLPYLKRYMLTLMPVGTVVSVSVTLLVSEIESTSQWVKTDQGWQHHNPSSTQH